jgi:hypothetical protein
LHWRSGYRILDGEYSYQYTNETLHSRLPSLNAQKKLICNMLMESEWLLRTIEACRIVPSRDETQPKFNKKSFPQFDHPNSCTLLLEYNSLDVSLVTTDQNH